MGLVNTELKVPSYPTLIYRNMQDDCFELTKTINFFGSILRNALFYPLHAFQGKDLPVNSKDYKGLLKEKEYYKKFWENDGIADPNLKKADFIKDNYQVHDQPIVVSLQDGKKITASCRIIEPKNFSKDNVFNVLVVPGNLSLNNGNLMSFYDLLGSNLKKYPQDSTRFFIFGHYEMVIENEKAETSPYIPPNLDAAGEILKRVVATLKDNYGKLNLIYGHSLGCITMASMLKRSTYELLPTAMHFDRGPRSIEEASKSYWFGKVLNLISKHSGLSIEVDKEIKKFFKRCYKENSETVAQSSCLVTGVENDMVFPDNANLATSETLNKLAKITKFSKWIFSPPSQIAHFRAHHNWRLIHLNNSYLSSSFGDKMHTNENLAQSTFRIART